MTMNNNETFVRDTNKSTLKVKTSVRGGALPYKFN